jgi:large subunit ribosomal protein L29
MKANEFRDLTHEELQKKALSLKQELFTQRFKLSTGQLENTSTIKKLRRDVARAITVLKQNKAKE